MTEAIVIFSWILVTLFITSFAGVLGKKYGVQYTIAIMAALIVIINAVNAKMVNFGPFIIPAGTLLFATTFLITDIISEFPVNMDYKRKKAVLLLESDQFLLKELEKELKEDINILKAFKMVLIHDIIEIYAGDTFAFDKEGKKSKKDREEKAAEKLFSQLPDDLRKELYKLWKEYEEGITPESKIIKAIDKIQPILSNLCSEGKSWKLKNVTYKDIDEYKRKFVEKNRLIKEIYEELLKEARERKLI